MIKEFTHFIEKEKEKDMFDFLRNASKETRKELAPHVKKLEKHYSNYAETSKGHWQSIGTEQQRNMLQSASFVCCNRADFEKTSFPIWMISEERLAKIIDWYCPDWLSDFVNKQASGDFFPHYFTYDWLVRLQQKGHLQPSKEVIAKSLVNAIFKQSGTSWSFDASILVKYPQTLSEDIWHLFDVQTDIHYANRWLNFGEKNQQKMGWIEAFKKYSDEGLIERKRLLREAILASNKNFNKVLSGWFIDLFTTLEPTTAEILDLQSEMRTALSSQHSKPVNTVLSYFKKITKEKTFDAEAFLDSAAFLLSSNTKKVVITTLQLLESIGKTKKSLRQPVCQLASQAFIQNDEEIQTRAAKLIGLYKKELDASFSEVLLPYMDGLLSSARTMLGDLVMQQAAVPHTMEEDVACEKTIRERNSIPAINNIDDLIFFASQAFDNNQLFHLDMLPAALVDNASQLRHENIARLEPALQRAIKLMRIPLTSSQGYLDHMLAVFFIDVCIYLVRKYKDEADVLHQLFLRYQDKDAQASDQWMAIGKDTSYLASWTTHGKETFYRPHQLLLLCALDKIRNEDDLPLLSTPTHEPAFISPVVLVERLARYQQENKTPNPIDFQIAVSRCHFENTEEAVSLARQKLKGELKDFVLYLLSENPLNGESSDRDVWMCAALAKKEKRFSHDLEKLNWDATTFNMYAGQREWKTVNEDYINKVWNYQKKEYTDEPAKRKMLYVSRPQIAQKEQGFLKKVLAKIAPKPSENPSLLYQYLEMKSAPWGNEYVADIQRLLLLTPNNPEHMLAEVLQQCFRYPTFWQETDKKIMIGCLQVLHELWDEPGEMAHLFLATSLLASDKTVANTAAEIWIEYVTRGSINSVLVGQIIGIHERVEFAPLKRFTDLASQNLFRISSLHNRELHTLIESLLMQLPDEPIKNLKKLLEMFRELVVVNNTNIGAGLEKKLNTWKETTGLKKVVESFNASTV